MRSASLIFLGALLSLQPCAQALAADVEFKPIISLSEEFTDNVNEDKDNPEADLITRVSPGLGATYETGRLSASMNYMLKYRNYAMGNRESAVDNYLDFRSVAALVEDHVYLDVSDNYSQVYSDSSKNDSGDGYTEVDQIDRNVVSVSPYLVLRPGERTGIKTGYRFVSTTYLNEGSEDRTSSDKVDKITHTGFFQTSHELTPKLSAEGGYTLTKLDSEREGNNYLQHSLLIGPSYEYAEGSRAYFQVGPALTDRESRDDSTDLFWTAGVDHAMDRLLLSLMTSTEYTEDPDTAEPVKTSRYQTTLSRKLDRGSWSLSATYNEFDRGKSERQDRSNTEEEESLGVKAQLDHDLTETLRGFVSLALDRRELKGGTVNRMSPSLGLVKIFPDDLTASLTYRYTDSRADSSEIEDDEEFKSNRVILELTKRF